MLFRSRREVVGIAADTLSFALSAAADTHPDEYLGVLRGTPASDLGVDADGDIVTDVLVVPGTESSPVQATLQSNLVPNDSHTIGSIHSHPNGVLEPSAADRSMFGKWPVHVIMGAPYESDCWRSFDREGEPRSLDVFDVDLPDPESFFDFTQADIDEEL
ncbi:Mov34/MPN/PAD-1 family protein [Salarchaeum japonicum]|uniref:Mov34/MPN/PAD-1 family protein n=1 Tax=Salarchaeum japonicum TaxID=555573 RepID=A0AAV3T3P9_9EURY|nr:Mov34/MPN/PAD-1 family protein [Salarchaeum japonicum]